MAFIPYLFFSGRCAEAFAFYGEVFGGKVISMRFRDAPPAEGGPAIPEAERDWIMHAQIDTADGVLMGADAPAAFGGGQAQAGFRISVSRPGADEAGALFARLAEGGAVVMPFGPTFFANGFGLCTDRFGTSWMVSTQDPKSVQE